MSEAPRNSEGNTEEQCWANLEGQVGSERASTLLDIIEFRNNEYDWEAAMPLAESAVEIAREADADQILARCLFIRAYLHRRHEKWAEGAADAMEALRIFERYDATSQIVDCYFELSVCFENQQMFDEAIKYSDLGIKTAEETEGHHALGYAYRQRYDVLKALDKPFEELMEALSKTRQAFRKEEYPDNVLSVDEEAARLLSIQGDYEGARNLLQDCFNVAITRDEGRAAHFAQRLGYVLRRFGDYEKALESLNFAYEYCVANDVTDGIARAQFEMAMCHWNIGNRDDAITLVSRARSNFDVVGIDGGVLDCDVQKAAWYHNVGRFEEAENLNAILIETTTGMNQLRARTRYADNLYRRNKLQDALEASYPVEGDEEFFGTSTWYWREEVRAQILVALHRFEEAHKIAVECVGQDLSDTYSSTRGWLFQLYGDHLEAKGDMEGARHWWTQATANYLAANLNEDAKYLATRLMPRADEDKVQ